MPGHEGRAAETFAHLGIAAKVVVGLVHLHAVVARGAVYATGESPHEQAVGISGDSRPLPAMRHG